MLTSRRVYILPTRAGWAFAAVLAVTFIAGMNYGNGLALLLTTSFLGLRRYLRQRQLEMPADMAAAITAQVAGDGKVWYADLSGWIGRLELRGTP